MSRSSWDNQFNFWHIFHAGWSSAQNCVLNFQSNHSAWISWYACLIPFLLHASCICSMTSIYSMIDWYGCKSIGQLKNFCRIYLKRWISHAIFQRTIRLCRKKKIDSIFRDILSCKKLSYSRVYRKETIYFLQLETLCR